MQTRHTNYLSGFHSMKHLRMSWEEVTGGEEQERGGEEYSKEQTTRVGGGASI